MTARGGTTVNQEPGDERATGMSSSHSTGQPGTERLVLRLAGAGLLASTAGIHLDLYLTGYDTIPTIGGLFLLQVIAAFLLAGGVVATGSRVVAAAGAGFAVCTLGGYLLSIWAGLFGFREVRTTAGIVAAVIEIAAFAVLAGLALLPAPVEEKGAVRRLHDRVPAGEQGLGAAIAVVALGAILVTGFTVAGASSGAAIQAGAGTELKTTSIHGVLVLTNSKGFTLYWFAHDSPDKSVCNGSCASYWPPVKAPVRAGPGVTGAITAITRADGSKQAAYDGHPLYAYIGDSRPGQANGNNLNLNGGRWHEVAVSLK